ncbi:hypothetical protein TCAL_00186 [Tigriopus californicus]|uniref:DUF4772 domain-containing protein n=1 Tax=Tigriopus californicus TaxID=6832 RepID=A0A553P503_TIGCA|nr:hypothetical protein TCAL_00186 [Tigriopus californicus]|eukprot:TCALIF_00186-PA protein Name:"Similar to znf395 Zinc finger protein 395 (Xenopus laevis)" AED:0.29 eAED:0.29 QI:0/0/0/1/1/1/5/0/416
MSTGKRVAKRSILGTKVMVPGQDGLYHPGWIQAVKTPEGSLSDARYAVKFEETKRVFEFCENDILGPGFESVTSKHLLPGQVVFVTHNNREMCGKVVRHDVESQDVLVKVFGGGAGNSLEEETVLLKIEDIRLLESRKSARLVNSDTDFSKLADVSIAMAEKKKIQKGLSSDVPRSDYVQIAGSRKRRTSENLPDDEETLSECSAAMLLMKLSCSPHSPRYFQGDLPSPLGVDDVLSSSGASSFRSLTPSPPLSSSVTDEGIVKDIRMKSTTIYQCTFPGCREQRLSVESIESHVRKEHLKRPEYLTVEEDEDRDHEEEFYYTEIEQSHPLEAPFTHLASPNNGTTTGKSPARRPRDGKKCRKVYGLEQRDLWCTQCKWKKACARFGTNASEPMPTHHQSLLISAQNLSSHTLSPR